MADKLLPCPFCGGEARILTDMQDTTTPVFSVVCDECESITYFGDVLDKEGTVDAWNNRPSPWHTGTPTEEGWYLIEMKDWEKQRVYYVPDYVSVHDLVLPTVQSFYESHLWQKIELSDEAKDLEQKIEPYKED